MAGRKSWSRGSGYAEDSKFEEELRYGLFKNLEYHPKKINYTIAHTYEPDWVIRRQCKDECKCSYNIYIEAKGAFRESSELQKYTNIRDQLPDGDELVFLFQKPNAPIYFKAKRKDGTKMSHAQWCDKNRFLYFDITTIQELLKDV